LAGIHELIRMMVQDKAFARKVTEAMEVPRNAGLAAWDAEFCAVRPRGVPSWDLEVVPVAPYGSDEAVGLTSEDTNLLLLRAEDKWVAAHLHAVLAGQFEPGEDFNVIPSEGNPLAADIVRGRRKAVFLESARAVEALRDVVSIIQTWLCGLKHDWVIRVISRSSRPAFSQMPRSSQPMPREDFSLWIYAAKLVTVPSDAEAVRRCLGDSGL
jgi:hypothetical protein